MNKNLTKISCVLVSTLALTGCIDNGYDLSDIDTTTQIKVKDLIVPLNVDDITLSDIITVKDGDKIQEVTLNGQTFYAVKESGEYHSDPVKIPTFESKSTPISSTNASFKLFNGASARKNVRKATIPSIYYNLQNPVVSNLKYDATGIDKSIYSIDKIGVDEMSLRIDLSLSNYSTFSYAALENVEMALPKGLSIRQLTPSNATYSASTGVISIPVLALNSGKASLSIIADGIDLAANGASIDYSTHSMAFRSQFNINKATAVLTPSLTGFTPMQEISFHIDYTLGNFKATSFTGDVEYKIDGSGLKINPIHLNDLPSFLADQRTNLILSNPQIYLQINNPVGKENLDYRSGLEIISAWDDARKSFPLNNITIPHSKGEGPYNFCLSPERPANIPADYAENVNYIAYPGLGNILSGNGLPSTLDIRLINPQIYRQHAVDFKLGQNLPGMKGSYLLLAPLALKGNSTEGSVIVYSDTKKDWDNSELDNMTIETLELMADVTSTIPFNATLEAYPLDKDGNKITYTAADGSTQYVKVKGAVIPAGANQQPITIQMEGIINGLDGVTFEAIVRPDGNDTPLAPSQTIVLKNLKAKVGGYYTTDF